MRWFNDAAYDASDDAAWDRIREEYYGHVRRIAPSLPSDLARLALEPELNLHDARFERVEIDVGEATASIVVIAGDLQVGYRRLAMDFSGATWSPTTSSGSATRLAQSSSRVAGADIDL